MFRAIPSDGHPHWPDDGQNIIQTASRRTEENGNRGGHVLSRSSSENLMRCRRPPRRVCWTPEQKAFSYNKRTMDWAVRPFWPLWQFLESIITLSIP
jgi:hypothetical protein